MKIKIEKRKKIVSAALVLMIGFLLIILVGACLLTLPVSAADGRPTDFLSAAFTAVSATCVTGLSVVDIASCFSLFGQIVILCLIQVGGLGFMSVAVLISFVIRRAITPKERVVIAQSMGIPGQGGAVRFVRRILVGTVAFEGIGAFVLTVCFSGRYGIAEAIYRGIFISVSAFCNAGFDPLGAPDAPSKSLTVFQSDPVVLITIMVLIVAGGIGFIIWDDVWNVFHAKKRLGIYAKFVLICSAFLIVSGAALTFLFERNNAGTLGSLSMTDKILNSFFHSISLRTAGFYAVDVASFTEQGALVSILYMLIGGASGSTAGGIKVGTVGVIFVAAVCAAVGKSRVVIMKRRISKEIVLRALSIALSAVTLVLVAGIAISMIEHASILVSLYEAASACATVGLSMIGTSSCAAPTRLILMALMYMGRVGILTITYTIAMRMRDDSVIDYPNVNILVGQKE